MRSSPLRIGLLVALLAAGAAFLRSTGEDPAPKRKPWTTSRIAGNPEPPPRFKAVRPFPNLKFNHPVLIVRQPGSNRLVVAEQHGKIFSFEIRPDAKAELLHDFSKEPNFNLTKDASQFDAVYGFVFDPSFERNRYCYVCYTVKNDKKPNLDDGSRVSRFKLKETNPPVLDSASEEIVLSYLQGGHNGGDLHFGPDGYLYISTGDATDPNPPDKFQTGQDVSDLLSSVLRIDVHKKDPGRNYSIPKDNPFVGLSHNGKPVRGEVWAYGFRNPWRMSFDRATGDLWLGDVGWESWEMVHRIEKGGNYGWSIKEAGQTVNGMFKLGPTPIRPPAIELSHSIAASVTGGNVYRGKKFPELEGKYIFGDWMTRRIWAAKFNGSELASMDEITAPSVRIIAFGEDRDGEIFFLDYDAGTVHTFARNEVANLDPPQFPRTLSQTGLFQNAQAHVPSDGVYSFDINAKQWQDYSTSEYLVALPGTSAAKYFEEKKPLANDVTWNPFHLHLPKDGVLVKTISLEIDRGNPASKRRIETQILHFDGDAIQGYTYAWRDDQSDADLVPADGGEKSFAVKDILFGGVRPQTWTFASRVQCGQCHNAWAGYMLGFNREQLHREQPDGQNQLMRQNELGLIERVGSGDKPLPPFAANDLKKIKPYANPGDEKAPVADRARSYLNVNCGHCHRMGGGGSVEFHVNLDADVKNKNLWDAKPTRGGFDIPDARILAPGEPGRSVIYYRMAKFGGGRMPHLGSDFPDEAGLVLVGEWIVSLKSGGKSADALATTPDELRKHLGNPSTAISVARSVGRSALPQGFAKAVRETVMKLPAGPVRDLFDGYYPDPNKPKTLGTNPRPRAILALAGDATNGKKLFAAERSQCAKCHKIDGVGLEVGPDLSQIAKSRTREHLLESLLDPSRRIEPQYQSYLLRTVSGKSMTGLIVKRDAKEVVLRDAENKLATVPADDVESLDASTLSIMPSGQLRDFTPQEAADLLAFLSSRK